MERKMFLKADPLIFEHASNLRNNVTHAEGLLWSYLREKPLGYKFRRQHPISKYVADFYCHSLKLIIEVDGDIHSDPTIAKYDKDRQEFLEGYGLDFLRFTNRQVEKELEEVIRVIESYIITRSQNMEKPL